MTYRGAFASAACRDLDRSRMKTTDPARGEDAPHSAPVGRQMPTIRASEGRATGFVSNRNMNGAGMSTIRAPYEILTNDGCHKLASGGRLNSDDGARVAGSWGVNFPRRPGAAAGIPKRPRCPSEQPDRVVLERPQPRRCLLRAFAHRRRRGRLVVAHEPRVRRYI